jgi:hypothetical protein
VGEEKSWVRRTLSKTVFLALTVTVALAGVACSGDEGDDARDDETTSTTVDEEAAVLAAYEASWRAFEEAAADPVDPDHPALTETMTGSALNAVVRSLGRLAEMQQYVDGPPAELSPEVSDLSAERAVVTDCVSDAGAAYAADGSVITPANPTAYANEVVMVKENGVWKRSEFTQGDPCER